MKLPSVYFVSENPSITQLDSSDYMGAFQWRLEEPFQFVVNGYDITIKAGFLWEPSIPRGMWNTFPPHDPDFCAPTLLHDWIGEAEAWTYRYNDKCFMATLKYRGVSWGKRALMWIAVRAGGVKMHQRHKPHTAKTVALARMFCDISSGQKGSPLWHDGTTRFRR